MKCSSFIPLMTLVVFICSCESNQTAESLNSIDLLRGDITVCGGDNQFGETNFVYTCDNSVQESFNLALSLLHSFEYDEAEKAFVKVIDADPDCAMGYWGVAMSNFHALWLQSGTGYLEKGSKILRIAASLPKTERETDYLDAIGSFYDNWDTVEHHVRVRNFEKEMKKLHRKYPDDKEAAIFYALSLTASADPADITYSNQKQSGKLLTSLFPDQPNHPGIAHYIIHNYDYPELAGLALPTARRYAEIAPSSAHAQHMPSHIFTRLGLWNEVIQSNINSTASALCYGESIDPEGHWDEELHGMDYLVYAYLQVGDTQKAQAQHEYLKTFRKVFPANFKVAYSAAAIPARIALENRNWEEASALTLPPVEIEWNDFPWQRSILHYARALGSIRSGDVISAEKELSQLQANRQVLLDMKNEYMANQLQIQINTIQAWINLEREDEAGAIALMKEAVIMENTMAKHPVTPGSVLPAEELLGDLFLTLGRNAEALEAYENNLKQCPNRFNSIYGAAIAASRMANRDLCHSYFDRLLQLAVPSAERAELVVARNYLEENAL